MKIYCYFTNVTYIKRDLMQLTTNCFTVTNAVVYIKNNFYFRNFTLLKKSQTRLV